MLRKTYEIPCCWTLLSFRSWDILASLRSTVAMVRSSCSLEWCERHTNEMMLIQVLMQVFERDTFEYFTWTDLKDSLPLSIQKVRFSSLSGLRYFANLQLRFSLHVCLEFFCHASTLSKINRCGGKIVQRLFLLTIVQTLLYYLILYYLILYYYNDNSVPSELLTRRGKVCALEGSYAK